MKEQVLPLRDIRTATKIVRKIGKGVVDGFKPIILQEVGNKITKFPKK